MQRRNTHARLHSVRHTFATRLGACAMLAATAAFGGMYAWSPPNPRAVSEPRIEPAPADDPWREQLAQKLRYRMAVGKVYSYQVEHEAIVRRAGAPFADARGQATLTVHVVGEQEGALDLIVFVNDEGSGGLGPRDAASGERRELRLSSSLALRIAANGELLALRFLPEESFSRTRLLSTSLSAWLYVLPRFKDAASDDDVERLAASDTNGEFTAGFTVPHTLSDPFAFVMRKEKYRRALALTRVLSSEHKLVWDMKRGCLLEAHATDRFGKGARELGIEASESRRVKLLNVAGSSLSASELARYTAPSALYVEPQLNAAERRPSFDGKVHAWPELASELETLPADPQSERPMQLFSTMAASLSARPEMLAAALKEAGKYAGASEQFKVVVSAIGAVGTPEAQDGLIDLYEATDGAGKDLVIKTQALMAAPSTAATREMLLRTEESADTPAELRSVAGLALGSSLRHLGEGDHDESVEAVHAHIDALWSKAKLHSDKEYALEVIGNSGDSHFVDTLAREVQDPQSPHRVRAMEALRFMRDDRAAELLSAGLTASSEPAVQRAAVDAVIHQPWRPEYFAPLSSCFLQGTETSLRTACARAVLQQPSQQQQMISVLEQARRNGGLDEELKAFIDSQLM